MKKLSDGGNVATPIEGLICFHTSEDRANNVLNLLNVNIVGFPRELLVFSFNKITDNELTNMKNEFSLNNINFEMVDDNLSSNMLPYLIAVDNYAKEKKCLGIDISCMPIPFFTQILHFLYKNYEELRLIIYYTEPAYYNLDNLFDYSAYEGEIDIKAIPGYEGKTAQLNESKRVVFYLMGFEMAYLNKLIPQETNPDRIVPINGFPSYFPKYKDISLINNDVNFHELAVTIEFAEANNPFETYNAILALKDKSYYDYIIDIIPAGTKPMALGACLFALKNVNNGIRLIFPFPSEYKIHQSTGRGTVWEYII